MLRWNTKTPHAEVLAQRASKRRLPVLAVHPSRLAALAPQGEESGCYPRILLPSGSNSGSVMMVALRFSPIISISNAPCEKSPAISFGT